MLELIRNERRLDLSFEGFRFRDICRWKLNINETVKGVRIKGVSPNFQFNIFDVETRNYESHMIYRHVPYKELLKNENLIQNIGW